MDESLKLMQDRHNEILFDEPSHTYTHKTKEGLKFTSGTTFIGKFHEHFDAEAIATKLSAGDEIKKADLLCEWACSSYKGTRIHRIVELFALHLLEEYSFPKGYHEPQAEALIDYLLSFLHSGWKILVPEMKIWDEDYGICGTADMILYNDKNEVMIVDYKTCKSIPETSFDGKMMYEPITHLNDSKRNHYALQLSLYQYLLEKNTKAKIVGRVLLQSSERGDKALISVPYLKDEVISMLEFKANT